MEPVTVPPQATPWPFSLITTARREASKPTIEPSKQSPTNSRPGSSSKIPRPVSPAKSETKSEPKAETKTESKTESKPESKSEAGPATTSTVTVTPTTPATPQPITPITDSATNNPAVPSTPIGRPSFLSPLQSPLTSPTASPPSGIFSPTAAPSILSTTSEPPAISLDAAVLDTTPILNVKLTLPTSRLSPTAAGLKLRLIASLPEGCEKPISFHTRGTIFDPECPLLGRGGFWGIADSNRRPVRVGANKAIAEEKGGKEKKICARLHAEGGFLDFQGGDFITVRPGETVEVEKLFPREDLVGLKRGDAYTVYSRPDREKKKPARIMRAKWGERDEVAEGVTWVDEAEDGWEKVDLAHVVRDRGWFEVVVVVGNSVRFLVV
ncbi:hypothetical protein BZA77DRAFT_385954 [Pyronema omphalodes]|nr:hypothetical protein BZA77DRAFT_389858 [Pyronema omphalodes]KAI5818323.1 hypothetical protein BZA77DRAFT_385954 [Pyronema omphalodes]